MKNPGNLAIAGAIAPGGLTQLLVAENQGGCAFERAALGECRLVRGAIFIGHIEREKVLVGDSNRLAGVRNLGNRTVRAGQILGFIDHVASFIALFAGVLAIGVRNDGSELRGGLVLDAKRLPGFERIERVKRNAAALAGLGGHRERCNRSQFRFNALGLGGIGHGGSLSFRVCHC